MRAWIVAGLVVLGGLASCVSPALDQLCSAILLGTVGLVVLSWLTVHAVGEIRLRGMYDQPSDSGDVDQADVAEVRAHMATARAHPAKPEQLLSRGGDAA